MPRIQKSHVRNYYYPGKYIPSSSCIRRIGRVYSFWYWFQNMLEIYPNSTSIVDSWCSLFKPNYRSVSIVIRLSICAMHASQWFHSITCYVFVRCTHFPCGGTWTSQHQHIWTLSVACRFIYKFYFARFACTQPQTREHTIWTSVRNNIVSARTLRSTATDLRPLHDKNKNERSAHYTHYTLCTPKFIISLRDKSVNTLTKYWHQLN